MNNIREYEQYASTHSYYPILIQREYEQYTSTHSYYPIPIQIALSQWRDLNKPLNIRNIPTPDNIIPRGIYIHIPETGTETQETLQKPVRLPSIIDDLVQKPVRSTFIIDNLTQNKWTLDKSLTVTIEQYSRNNSVACFSDADIYGYGDSISEALDDLQERLINQLEFLLGEEKQVILGPVPQKQLEVLRYHIKKGV